MSIGKILNNPCINGRLIAPLLLMHLIIIIIIIKIEKVMKISLKKRLHWRCDVSTDALRHFGEKVRKFAHLLMPLKLMLR